MLRKIILSLGIFFWIASISVASDKPTKLVPTDGNMRPVAVLYIQNDDGTYSKVDSDTPLSVDINNFTLIKDYGTGVYVLPVSRALGKKTFSEEYTTAQTSVEIIAPESGKKLCISGIFMATTSTTGEVCLKFETSNVKVLCLYATKFNQLVMMSISDIGDVDEELSLTTTTANKKVFIKINYRSID